MKVRYGICFLTLTITFVYILIDFILNSFSTLDLALFCLFILASMVALIGMGLDKKMAWILSIVLFAFFIGYLVSVFLNSETIPRFLLIVINVGAFMTAVFGVNSKPSAEKELEEMSFEKAAAEKQFEILKDENKIEKKETAKPARKSPKKKPMKKKASRKK